MTDDRRRQVIARGLAVLSETFHEPVSELRAEAYLRALDDLSGPEFERAVELAIRHCAFFPKPAELRALVQGTAQDAAESAWALVAAEVRRVGYYGTPALPPAVLTAVRRVFGSWRDACAHLQVGPEGLWQQKRFMESYAVQEKHAALGLPSTLADLPASVRQFIGAHPLLGRGSDEGA